MSLAVPSMRGLSVFLERGVQVMRDLLFAGGGIVVGALACYAVLMLMICWSATRGR